MYPLQAGTSSLRIFQRRIYSHFWEWRFCSWLHKGPYQTGSCLLWVGYDWGRQCSYSPSLRTFPPPLPPRNQVHSPPSSDRHRERWTIHTVHNMAIHCIYTCYVQTSRMPWRGRKCKLKGTKRETRESEIVLYEAIPFGWVVWEIVRGQRPRHWCRLQTGLLIFVTGSCQFLRNISGLLTGSCTDTPSAEDQVIVTS